MEDRLKQAEVQAADAQAAREEVTRLTAGVVVLTGKLSVTLETLIVAAHRTQQLEQESVKLREKLSGALARVKEEAALVSKA